MGNKKAHHKRLLREDGLALQIKMSGSSVLRASLADYLNNL